MAATPALYPRGLPPNRSHSLPTSDAVYAEADRLTGSPQPADYVRRCGAWSRSLRPSDRVGLGPTRCARGESKGAHPRRVGIPQRRLRRGVGIRGGGWSEGGHRPADVHRLPGTAVDRSPILRPRPRPCPRNSASRPVRALAGLLIGLLLGALVALARGLLDKRVNSAKRAQAALGYPVVAEIPAESSDSSEAYRMLWLSVFREPLPEAVEQGDQWLEGADLALDSGYLARVGTVRSAVPPTAPRTVARPDPRTARGTQRGDGHLPGFGTHSGHRCGQLGHRLRRDRAAGGGGDHGRPRCPPWTDWSRRGSAGPLTDDERDRRLTGPLRPDDVRDHARGHQRSRRVVPGLAALRGPHDSGGDSRSRRYSTRCAKSSML